MYFGDTSGDTVQHTVSTLGDSVQAHCHEREARRALSAHPLNSAFA